MASKFGGVPVTGSRFGGVPVTGSRFADTSETSFLGDIGTLLKQGASQAMSTYQVGPQVISGGVEGTEGLIAKNLTAERFQPEAMRQVSEAFKDEAEAMRQAESWYSRQGLQAIGGAVAEIGKQLVTNPRGVAYFTAEQAANMVPAIVGGLSGAAAGSPAGPVGVVGGATVGAFGASAPMEIGAEFIGIVGGELAARNLAPTEENIKTLLADEQFRNTAISQARVKGATVAAVDAATSVIGGRITSGPMRSAIASAARESLETGAEVAPLVQRNIDALPLSERFAAGAKGYGVDVVGAGVGETAGQVAAYGEADLEEVALEVLGEAGGAIVEVPALGKKFVSASLRSVQPGQAAPVQPGQAAPVQPTPTPDQRLQTATSASEAVQAAGDMIDMDIEALEREAGIADSVGVSEVRTAEPQARGLVAQAMAPAVEPTLTPAAEPTLTPAAEPTLTVDTLAQADISAMPAPERQEFLDDLVAARTANLPEQRQAALTRAAEVYGRTVGPVQQPLPRVTPQEAITRAQELPQERARTAAPSLDALLAADTRGLDTQDREDFNANLAMARSVEPGPVQTAALQRAAEVYGRAIGPVQPRTAVAAEPSRRTAVPRPTNILGRPASEYTPAQLQDILNNNRVPAITRRGVETELRARTSAPVQETISENFIAVPETVPVLAAQPVAGQSAGQRARETAQRAMDTWAASNGIPSPVTFNAAPAELEAGVAEIADLIGSQWGGRVFAFSDTRPGAINGVAIGKVAYVNVSNTQAGVQRTALHEFKHTVEQIAKAEAAAGITDTPAQEFVEQIDSVFDDMTDEGKRAYLENFIAAEELASLQGDARETRVQELLQDPELRSEMVADFLGNRATDKQFWQDLAKADPTGFEGFVKRWLAAIDNLLATLRGAKGRSKTESAKVDTYIRDLNKAKLTAQSALINYRKATAGQAPVAAAGQAPVAADDLAPTPEDVVKAEAFEEKYDILPYTSRGQLDIKFSIKESGKYGTHPVLGIPVNKNGTVSLYFPTTNDTAKVVRRDKVLRGETPSSNRIYLTNESSAPKVQRFPGLIAQPLGGANVLVQVDPNLVQVLTEYPDGRKDFFIPIAEGAAFKAKMTKLFTLNVPRSKGLSPDRTLLEIQKSIATAATKFKEASRRDRKALVSAAREVLRVEHNVGTLLGENGKLEKTRIGDYGLTYDGQSVSSLGLGLASAQKINDKQKLTSCPQSAICEDLCLGETSGQNMLYGGIGQFRSGPRLSQYLKTEAMVLHPEEFTTALMAEIDSFRVRSAKENYKSAIRLNVTSDFVPKILEPIISAFPDVMFYDYTKMNTDVIATNHHLTYSSTGASQVVNGETIINPESNWPRMVQRMRNGQNVAMAFTGRNDMPDFVQDEVSGERFQVWNGDNYDARFLDPKPGEPGNTLNKGMIIGLTNKDRTGPTDTAAKRHKGFFLDYDRARDGDTLIIKDQSALKETAARPVKLQFSRTQPDVAARIPELERAAQGIKEGTVTREQYEELVTALKPVTPYEEVPAPATEADIRRGLSSDKLDRIGVPSKTLKAGDPVGLRLDIPAYTNHGVWVVSVHEQIPGFAAGKSIGYESVAAVKNPTFGVVESAALNIAAGKPKATIAVMKGDWKPITPKQAFAAAKLALKSDSWVQVGMDPTRHAYFYDRASMEPVVSADEAIQVGPLVLAKNPVYGNKADFRFSRRQTETPEFKRWFGDSKVVDAEGKPLVVYHGTRPTDEAEGFDVFDVGAAGSYFTPDPAYAAAFTDDTFDEFEGARGPILPVYLSIKNPLIVKARDDSEEWQDFVSFGIDRAEILRGGYDGAMLVDADTGVIDQIIAVRPNQIKSAIGNTGAFDPATADIRFSRAQQNPMKLYSALARAADNGPVRAPAAQWKGLLRKQAKPEEITWSGVEDWLDLQEGNVSREAVSEFLAQNGVQVGEVVLGRADVYPDDFLQDAETGRAMSSDDWEREFEESGIDPLEAFGQLVPVGGEPLPGQGAAVQYANYQLPGGTNYREVLLTLPAKKNAPIGLGKSAATELFERDMMEKYGGDTFQSIYNKLTPSEVDRYEMYVREDRNSAKTASMMQDRKNNYQSTHWRDIPNVLAHIRMNDRVDADGARVLFVEELQSDWAQEGRKKGFKAEARLKEREESDLADRLEASLSSGLPAAPFVQTTDSWLNLALKRVITMAVEEGYDKIAFINGEQSAERYDLSKHVGSVLYRSNRNGSYDLDIYDPKDNRVHYSAGLSADEIENVVGKEVAQKIVNDEGRPGAFAGTSELAGLDLKVGGEGMKTFYDSIVPKTISKLLPKIGGGKLEQVALPTGSEDIRIDVFGDGTASVESGNMTLEFDTVEEAEAFRREAQTVQPYSGFAVTPTMVDQVMDAGLPLFSRAQNIFGKPMPAATWQIEDSVLDSKVIYRLQDKLVDTKRVVEAINASVGQIEDKWDPYLQEKLYHGVVAKQTKDFATDELKPLIEMMGRNKVTLEELDKYLHNRHAEERNIAIAQRNPALPDAGSGIPTADARAFLAALPPARRALLEGAARKIDSITKVTRDILISSGLEAQSTIDAWDALYKKYVPLMREELDYEGSRGAGTGRGVSVRGSSSRRAVGSADRRVVDIMANIAMQRERAIVRANKNKVSQALYGLALKNPSPDFWLPINPDAIKDPQALTTELINFGVDPKEAENIAKEPRESYVDPRTGLVSTRVNRTLRNLPNVVYTRVNGKDRFLILNNKNPRAERMAKALNNMDVDSLVAALSIAAVGTRWFASVNTQYNPIFGVINFARDVGAGALNLSTTPLADKKARVIADTIPALRGIYGSLRGGSGQGQWAALWDEFQKVGGQTGFRDQFSQSEERARALQKELDNLSAGDLKKAGQATRNWLSDYNTAMENAVRLSAYKAALDKGLSKQRAAELAKDLTVNFNKKGAAATNMGALYAFFNASVQGTTRLAQTLRGPAGKKIIYGGLLLGAVQAVALMAAGFEEDEPPGFVKERNIVIPIGGGDYLTWPMPLGFNVIPNVGRIATEWALSGFENSSDRAIEMITSFFDMFNPIGNAGISMQTLSPTVVDPLVALGENKDWTGSPISREDMSGLSPTPGYLRARDSASAFTTELARFFNLASGGTDFTPGKFSPTPEQLEYLAAQLTGGVGREVGKTVKTAEMLLSGEELPAYTIPLGGRLYGQTTGSAAESNRFYNNVRRMNLHNAELNGLRERRQSLQPYFRENPDARLIDSSRAAYRQVQALRNRKRDLLERKASREEIRRIEQQITNRMKQFNDRVSRIES